MIDIRHPVRHYTADRGTRNFFTCQIRVFDFGVHYVCEHNTHLDLVGTIVVGVPFQNLRRCYMYVPGGDGKNSGRQVGELFALKL